MTDKIFEVECITHWNLLDAESFHLLVSFLEVFWKCGLHFYSSSSTFIAMNSIYINLVLIHNSVLIHHPTLFVCLFSLFHLFSPFIYIFNLRIFYLSFLWVLGFHFLSVLHIALVLKFFYFPFNLNILSFFSFLHVKNHSIADSVITFIC